MTGTRALDGLDSHALTRTFKNGNVRMSEMTRRLVVFVFGLLASLLSGNGVAVQTAPYFPLNDNASWAGRINGLSAYTVTVSPGVFDVNGYPTKRIVYSPGTVFSYYSNDVAGIRVHREVLQALPVPGCGVTDLTTTYSPPLSYVPAEVVVGGTYSSSGTALIEASGCVSVAVTYSVISSVSGAELITVPLGMFVAVKLVMTVNVFLEGVLYGSDSQTLWLAPQVGVVKEFDPEAASTLELVSTNVVDSQPDPFSFNAVVSAPLGSQVISNAITVTGTTAPSPISVSGGEYRINGGAWLTTAGSVINGQRVEVRATTPNVNNSSATTILMIGGASAGFTVNSPFVADTTPDVFGFTPQTKVSSGTSLTSNSVTVTGINVAVAVSVSGGSYSVNGGAFTSAPGTVRSGDTVTVRLTSPSTDNTRSCAAISIGDLQTPFCVTTGPLGMGLGQIFQLLLDD
jgi:hypothetical protein